MAKKLKNTRLYSYTTPFCSKEKPNFNRMVLRYRQTSDRVKDEFESVLCHMPMAQYLKTRWWFHAKNETIAKSDGKCPICGSKDNINAYIDDLSIKGRGLLNVASIKIACDRCLAGIPMLPDTDCVVLPKPDKKKKKARKNECKVFYKKSSHYGKNNLMIYQDSILGRKTKFNKLLDDWMESNPKHQKSLELILRKRDYKFFLKTDYWFAIRNECLKRAENECEVCGSKDHIQVHHLTYAHHGLEHLYLDDLMVLCDRCHKEVHHKN